MGGTCEEMQDRPGRQPSVCLAINSSVNGKTCRPDHSASVPSEETVCSSDNIQEHTSRIFTSVPLDNFFLITVKKDIPYLYEYGMKGCG